MQFEERMFPPVLPIRPDKALIAFIRLVRNKEETRHVFEFSVNLNGGCLRGAFERFLAGPNGDLLVRDDPQALLRALDQRERLRALPSGTTGRVYAEFMDREGLVTNGVAETNRPLGPEYDAFNAAYPEWAAFIWYLNLTHDMFHVLTGYNRDSLGEAALLNTTSRVTGNRGIRYLSALASLRIKAEAPELPVFKVMTNARLLGQRMDDLMQADFVGMLERPLRDVRKDLNIIPDPVYAALDQDRLLALVQPQTA